MNFYSRNITADSLTGAIFALEGLKKSVVILNGPTGCKFYHSAVSDYQHPRQSAFDPLNYPGNFYFGQPRVPSTWLDSYDYVYGSKEKLGELLDFIRGREYSLVAVVNSPGAALIGDDLEGIASQKLPGIPVLTMESPGFSKSFYQGFGETLIRLLKQLSLSEAPKRKKSVNLIGVSIYNKYHQGDIAEIKRILALCGIEVNCVLCADTSLGEIQRLPRAALNVVLYPELGLDIARYLEEAWHMPWFLFDRGLPVGFELTEAFVAGVCERVYGDAFSPELMEDFAKEQETARADAYIHISRLHSLTGLPRGTPFSVEGSSSALYAYTCFLMNYMGMVPNALSPVEGDPGLFTAGLKALLEERGLEQALQRDIQETRSDLVFASGDTIAQLKLKNYIFSGIETELPTLGYIDVLPKTHLGLKGALLLTEQVLNGMIF